MEAKRVFIAGFTLIMALALISVSVFAETATSPSISAQILKYEPYPAEPGKYFDLWINIENSGLGPAERFRFEIQPKYPFSLDSGENSTRYFGAIEPGKNGLLKYRIRVAPDAVEGYGEINCRYQYGYSDIWLSKNFSVYVQTSDAVISIESIKTTPEQMAPGKASDLEITLKNIAASPIKDITLKLDLSSLSFYPMGTATEQKSYLMESGAYRVFSFRLMAGPSLSAGIYKIPMSINYSDVSGNVYSKTDYATVIVGDNPDITAGIERTTILGPGESGTVTLNIINKGLTGIKLLSVNVEDSDYFEITSPSRSLYIGSLDSDGYETADYTMYVKPEASGTLVIPITLDFRDDNNNQFTRKINVEMKLYTQEELVKYGMRLEGGLALPIIILVLIVIGYLVYRKFFRKSSKR